MTYEYIRHTSVCHLYVTHTSWYVLVCHRYVIRIYPYNHPCVLVCHPYVTPMHSYVIRMPFVCTRASSDITLIYTYAIRMLLARGFTMNHFRVFVKQMTILYGVRFMVKPYTSDMRMRYEYI